MSNNSENTINGRVHSVTVTGSGGPASQMLTLNLDTNDIFIVDATVPSGVVAAMGSILQAALYLNAPLDVHFVEENGVKKMTWLVLQPKQ